MESRHSASAVLRCLRLLDPGGLSDSLSSRVLDYTPVFSGLQALLAKVVADHSLSPPPVIFKETANTTLCRSGPNDEYISFHIRAAGDWTKALYKRCQESLERDCTERAEPKFHSQDGAPVSPLSTLSPTMKVHMDGPFGAPAQDHSHFDCLLLVVSLHPLLGSDPDPSCNEKARPEDLQMLNLYRLSIACGFYLLWIAPKRLPPSQSSSQNRFWEPGKMPLWPSELSLKVKFCFVATCLPKECKERRVSACPCSF